MKSGMRCLILIVFALPAAFACTCGDTATACEAYGRAAAVFIGTAGPPVRQGAEGVGRTETVIRIKEVLFGNVGNIAIAESLDFGCGFAFEAGKEYLIYAGDASETANRSTASSLHSAAVRSS